MSEPFLNESQTARAESPARYLGSSALLNLQDSRLRLRARSLTQLCKTDRERAMALHNYVKKLPFERPFKFRLRTAHCALRARCWMPVPAPAMRPTSRRCWSRCCGAAAFQRASATSN